MTKEVVTCCFGTPSLPRSGAGAGERWWRDSGEAGKNRKGALWWQEGSGAKQVASTREFTLILISVCQICNDWGPSFSTILPLLEQVKYVAKWARNDTYKSCNLYILKCICLAVVHENYENEKRNQSPVITLLVPFFRCSGTREPLHRLLSFLSSKCAHAFEHMNSRKWCDVAKRNTLEKKIVAEYNRSCMQLCDHLVFGFSSSNHDGFHTSEYIWGCTAGPLCSSYIE